MLYMRWLEGLKLKWPSLTWLLAVTFTPSKRTVYHFCYSKLTSIIAAYQSPHLLSGYLSDNRYIEVDIFLHMFHIFIQNVVLPSNHSMDLIKSDIHVIPRTCWCIITILLYVVIRCFVPWHPPLYHPMYIILIHKKWLLKISLYYRQQTREFDYRVLRSKLLKVGHQVVCVQ